MPLQTQTHAGALDSKTLDSVPDVPSALLEPTIGEINTASHVIGSHRPIRGHCCGFSPALSRLAHKFRPVVIKSC